MKYLEYKLTDNAGGETISIPIPESYKDCGRLIQSDYYRRCKAIKPIWKIYLKTLYDPCIAVQFWARVSAYETGLFYKFSRFCLRHYRLRYGISFNSRRVGYGLFIGHEYLQVNPCTVIGNNVNISQFTTIGTNTKHGAIIGNNIYIGPSVCIVEGVNIGSNVTIGAGTIVVKDLQKNSTYVGNPARRVGENRHPQFIRNPWPLSS